MDVTVTDTLEWKTAANVRYPNITVCNKRYFSLRRLKGEVRNTFGDIVLIVIHFKNTT